MSLDELNKEIIACRKCPRLVAWREEVARTKRKAYMDWDYWGKPVPGFGDPKARVLVVGLAPGAHGSNRTGRNFTGDASGNFLYPALFRAGFASQPESTSREDGLVLRDMYITACGRCAPPKNKPTGEELDNCQPFLEREVELIRPKVFVALGRVAFERVKGIFIRQLTEEGGPREAVNGLRSIAFSHGATYPLDTSRWIVASYHPSQQNTLTGKLTLEMFDAVWAKVKELVEAN
jgi:uracil-DNA glycosylase family 4